MPPGSDEKGGGIRWQTEDAADALLSDIMSDVSQDADAERAALEAARQEKEEAERQAREDAERRQNTEIEQRLREEEARRAAAEEQRQRLAREAEIARAVAAGEVSADAAQAALSATDEPTVDETGPVDETRPDTGGFDQVTAPQATSPLRSPPLAAPAPAPPPKTSWGLTLGLVIPLVLIAAALGLLLVKETDRRTEAETNHAKARTEAGGLATQLAAQEKKVQEQKQRYDTLQGQLNQVLAAATSGEATSEAKPDRGRKARKTSKAGGSAGKAKPPKKKKMKKGRDFDLGNSIFDGGKDGKIVF